MPYSSETIELMRIDVFPFLIGNFSQSMGANRLMTEDLVLRTARYWSTIISNFSIIQQVNHRLRR